MAIRVRCKNCGVKIEAKDELSGKIRPCPNCKSEILITPEKNTTPEMTADSETSKAKTQADVDQTEIITPLSGETTPIIHDNMEGLPTHHPPTKLLPDNRYFILSNEHIIAFWEVGKGWQFNIGSGFVSAKFHKELLPNAGTFKFIEIMINQLETGKQLTGIRTFSLPGKWVIPAIGREPDEILAKINGKAVMTKQQRVKLLAYIRQNYMPEFLQKSKNVYEYLLCEFTSESDVFEPFDGEELVQK